MSDSETRTFSDNFVEEDSSFSNEDEATVASDHNDEEELKVGKGETKAVFCLRLAVLGILSVLATSVCIAVYHYGRQGELRTFERQFNAHALKVVAAFEKGATRRVKALRELSMTFTSQAQVQGVTWPFVTLHDFERRAAMTLDLSDAVSVMLSPLVTSDMQDRWSNYSLENQRWYYEGLLIQENNNITKVAQLLNVDEATVEHFLLEDSVEGQEAGAAANTNASNWDGINGEIHKLTANGPVQVKGNGTFFPVWQFAPAIAFTQLVNFEGFGREMKYMSRQQETFVSKSFDFVTAERGKKKQEEESSDNSTSSSDEGSSDEESSPDPGSDEVEASDTTVLEGPDAMLELFLERRDHTYSGGPYANIFVPVFDRNDGTGEFVATLSSFIYWHLFLENLLPEKADGVICVLENTLNQSFTYQINGPDAVYIGPDDFHDHDFDDLEVEMPFGTFLGDEGGVTPAEERFAAYRIRLYPSQTFRSYYVTSIPKHFALILAATFVTTVMVFLIYDTVVERRQRLVLSEAIKTGRVVNSLFPDKVRDRLYENKKRPEEKSTLTKTFKNTLVNESCADINSARTSSTRTTSHTYSSPPIADLYPDCTVLFADIKGFTKWSSEREPVQVFTLLEALYGSFDKSARKLKVCKIETIGDCYLAVTGIPEPQEDHAVIMARFAIQLDTKMNQIAQQLVPELGEGTRDLQMRVGLHSGPVTAGVLRGEKARFQLFGDTVNTASRMESTGEGGRIHVSEQTAEALISAEKDHWIEKRDSLVEAKGKGSLQTYWLKKDQVSRGDTLSMQSSMISHSSRLSRSALVFDNSNNNNNKIKETSEEVST